MPSASTYRRHARAQALYNDRYLWPVGLAVKVRRDNGKTLKTVTIGPVMYSKGGAYVCVAGIPGNTRLDRVTPVKGGT